MSAATHWPVTLRLANGRTLWLRPIEAADAEPLRAGFSLLSPNEVRQRFLYALTELTPAMAARLTQPGADAFALVAAEPLPPGEALIGAVARAALDPADRSRAEFAILVSRYVARMGLGTHLLNALIHWARQRGARTLCGLVLEHNHAMLALAQRLGFSRERTDTPGVLRIVRTLDPPSVPPAR
jgi:RimJ/RimL family protein N-acetyltransferase